MIEENGLATEPDTFIGVEANRNRAYPFTFAAIDRDLAIRTIGQGTIKDAYAFLAGQKNALAAINFPTTLSKGLLKCGDIREKTYAKSQSEGLANLRLVEFELLERGVQIARTPGSLKKSPQWMKLGFRLFEELGKLGYCPFPAEGSPRQFFECQGEAAFWNLLGHAPLKEHTLEGGIQRQLALQSVGLPVPDAMQFFEEITRHHLLNSTLPLGSLFSNEELNALAAAYTAWLAIVQADKVNRIGDEIEGFIFLPKQMQSIKSNL